MTSNQVDEKPTRLATECTLSKESGSDGLADTDLALVTARLFVRRKKGSLSTHQPVEGDELRAIRAWLRERSLDNNAACSPFLFVGERAR